MFPTVLLSALLLLAFGRWSPAQDPAPPIAPSTDKATPNPATVPTPTAKPAAARKHVYTDDDLKGGSSPATMDFSQVNDCDRNCFDQVRQLAHAMPTANWKRDVLSAIDVVRKDSEWQQYLRALYEMHVKFCALGDSKRDELNRVADPRNVTPQELSVDDKYDAKFKQLQSSLQALTLRQAELTRKFSANPFSLQFANLQASRISNAPCATQYYRPSDNDADP